MRKFIGARLNGPRNNALQCGRIYKDAEIKRRMAPLEGRLIKLQCGRIYKDAEIGNKRLATVAGYIASMWPHL